MPSDFRKVPDVPDSFVITVMCAHAYARNAYIGGPGTSGTPGIFSCLGGPSNRFPRSDELHSSGQFPFVCEGAR